MPTIALSNSVLVAIVDDADHEELSRYRWSVGHKQCAQRTDRSTGRKVTVLMHRQIMGFSPGDPWVDHRDGNRLNNRRCNLRAATAIQNAQNRVGANRTRNGQPVTSRFVGVYWRKDIERWGAMVKPPGSKQRHLGYFDDELDAARVAAETRHRLGFSSSR